MGRQHISFPLLKQQDWKTTTLNNLHGRSTQQFTRRARQAKTRRKTLKKDNGSVFSYSSKTGRTRRKTEDGNEFAPLAPILSTTFIDYTKSKNKTEHERIRRTTIIWPARNYACTYLSEDENEFAPLAHILLCRLSRKTTDSTRYWKTEDKNEFAPLAPILSTTRKARTRRKTKTNSPDTTNLTCSHLRLHLPTGRGKRIRPACTHGEARYRRSDRQLQDAPV